MKKKYVLIDDDQLVRMTWEYKAKASSVDLKTFDSSASFFASVGEIDKDSLIFIDSNLNEDLPGEKRAKEIYEKGFSQIYIATGSEASELDFDPTIIKGIRGKEPPF